MRSTCAEEHSGNKFVKTTIFGKLRKKYPDFQQKFSAGLLKHYCACRKIRFGRKNEKNSKFKIFLQHLSKNYSDFQQKLFVRIVETAYYESIGTFWCFFVEKKREHVHSELAKFGGKKVNLLKVFPSVINYDGKYLFLRVSARVL